MLFILNFIVSLFFQEKTYFSALIPVLYPTDPLSVVSKVPVMFDKLKSAGQTDRQTIVAILHLVVENHAEVSHL